MKLREYRSKRDPTTTNEPFGGVDTGTGVHGEAGARAPTRHGRFVVHQHDASRMHFDLRLEQAGVLASFAVPKGPSLDPEDKHLAVHTEDHPIEYLDFEAVIPEGNYGAGAMIVWDRGTVTYLEDPAEVGIEKGKLDFVLAGTKVRGRFALVRLAKGNGREWLLFKKRDAFADPKRKPTEEQPWSLLSGLTVKELPTARQRAEAVEARAAELGAPLRRIDGPRTVPMLCATADARPPDPAAPPPVLVDPARLYELKLDGVRIIAQKTGEKVTLTYRSARDTTASYPEVVRAMRALAPNDVVLDGEIITFDEQGRPSFERLASRIHAQKAHDVARAMLEAPVVYVAFDVLAVGERDLRGLPLRLRKELLRAVVPGPGIVRTVDHVVGDGRPLWAFCRAHALEGVIAKLADGAYRPGPVRSQDWLKVKLDRDDEFVVIGYTAGSGGRTKLGALDLASFRDGALVVRGKVGSGLDGATIDRLLRDLEPLDGGRPANLVGELLPAPQGRVFVRPTHVVHVRHHGFTEGGHLRHPVFRGIAADRRPEDCTAAPAKEKLAAVPREAAAEEPAGGSIGTPLPPAVAAAPPAVPTPRRQVAITNRNKILWPEAGYTKGDLVGYYETVAPTMLPYLAERPVVLVRYPDGIDGKNFYQWNVPGHVPDWIRTISLGSSDGEEKRVFLVDDVDTLIFLANLACIPIHVLACRASALGACDFATVDFDLKGARLAYAVTLARTLKATLDAIGLVGFPKTSGQSGLHVLVPLGPGVPFEFARSLCDLLARWLVARHPDLATIERIVKKRAGKVYVDTGQTGPTRTIVAPYSVRAQPLATVSTPLAWDEVEEHLVPAAFTLHSVPERIARIGDPMAAMLAQRPDLPAAITKLEALFRGAALAGSSGPEPGSRSRAPADTEGGPARAPEPRESPRPTRRGR